MPCYIRTTIVKTYRYVRVVYTEVEETDKRLKDEQDPKYGERYTFIADGSDAALNKAKTNMLTGWESYGKPEYEAVSSERVDSVPNVDVVV